MLPWLRFKIADGKFYCGKFAALPAAAAMKRTKCSVIFDLSEAFNDRRAQHVRTRPRDSHFRERLPVVAAAPGTVGVYRTGVSRLLAFGRAGTNLHLINAPAEEFPLPPLGIPRCGAAACVCGSPDRVSTHVMSRRIKCSGHLRSN